MKTKMTAAQTKALRNVAEFGQTGAKLSRSRDVLEKLGLVEYVSLGGKWQLTEAGRAALAEKA